MQGLVVKNTGNNLWVRFSDGNTEMCKVKGNFRIKGIKSTNPVVVGDRVEVDSSKFVVEITDRKNYIIRRPTNLSKQIHIIAANIDIALLIVSLKKPETSLVFIDRFIASAEAFDVPVVIIFNKIDLLSNNDKKKLDSFINIYQSINYKCIKCVATENIGIDEIKQTINGKVALLSGNSGVGKSTLINAIIGESKAATSNISAYHQKGMHTTTFSEIYCVDNKTYMIDTPGIKGFGIVKIDENEVSHFFREIFAEGKNCRFPNCTHTHEPDCAVIKAVENGTIAESRYKSYLSIIDELKNNSKYRTCINSKK